jgi:hypothetical protein
MYESSPAGHVNPASFSASIKSAIAKSIQVKPRTVPNQPLRSTGAINYQIADRFGRCFLKVCYWAEVFLSFTRGDESVRYPAQPKPANRPSLHPATASISNFISEQAGSTRASSSDGRDI